MRKKKSRFLQKAIKRPGRVKEAAKRDGISVAQEARKMSHSSDPSARGAGKLAMRFKGMAKKGNIRRKKHRSSGRS